MTNSAALVKESIWRDRDFRRLSRMAQCTYQQLLAQKEIDRAGLIRLHTRSLLRGCEELTEDQLVSDLAMLEMGRFVFVDLDTDELFVRAYMRTFNIAKYPQYLANAVKGARMVESLKIRHELALELQRLRMKVASDAAADIHNPEQCEHCASTVSEPSDDVPERCTVPAPCSGSTSSSSVLLRTNHLGEEPPQFCPDHPNGTTRKCRACGEYRVAHAAWVESRQANELTARRQARENCPRCKGTNTYEDADGEIRPCRPHVTLQEVNHA